MASAPETQPLSSTKTKKKKNHHGSHHHHHHHGATPAAAGEPTNNVRRSNRKPPRQLEFNQAMRDFKTMFPEMDMDVIEAVLRANNGAVDATIDQLLSMQSDSPASPFISSHTAHGFGAIRNEEEPPPYSPPSPNSPFTQTNVSTGDKPLPPTPSNFVIGMPNSHHSVTTTTFRNWNPPLLGTLPDDFLRIIPTKTQPEMVSSTLRQRMAQNKERQNTTRQDDVEAQQMLEDERVALSLQNQEFLQELQRNPEFLSSLENDYSNAIRQGAVEPSSLSTTQSVPMGTQTSLYMEATTQVLQEGGTGATTRDPAFEDKLSHMGKSTKAKLAQLAKKFNKKKKKRNSRYGPTETDPSSDSLLDEYAEDDASLLTQRRRRAEENIYSDVQSSSTRKKRGNEEPIIFYSEDDHFPLHRDT